MTEAGPGALPESHRSAISTEWWSGNAAYVSGELALVRSLKLRYVRTILVRPRCRVYTNRTRVEQVRGRSCLSFASWSFCICWRAFGRQRGWRKFEGPRALAAGPISCYAERQEWEPLVCQSGENCTAVQTAIRGFSVGSRQTVARS